MRRVCSPARILLRGALTTLALMGFAPAISTATAAPVEIGVGPIPGSVSDVGLFVVGEPEAAGTLTIQYKPGFPFPVPIVPRWLGEDRYVLTGSLVNQPGVVVNPPCARLPEPLYSVTCLVSIADVHAVQIGLQGSTPQQVTLDGILSHDGSVNVSLGDGNDVLDAAALPNALTANGGGGADTLSGGANADTLNGDAGDDTLNGNGHGDTLNGGDDDDTLNGGDGHDTMNGDAGNDRFVAGAAAEGDDTIDGGTSTPVAGNPWATDVVDYSARTVPIAATLSTLGPTTGNGAAGESDSLTAIGGVRGGSASDTLTGGDGPDVLGGGPGDDTVNGMGGGDVLEGDLGADRLEGGGGDDRLLARSATATDADIDAALACGGDDDTVVRDPRDPPATGCAHEAPGFDAAPVFTATPKVGTSITPALSTFGDPGTVTISWEHCSDANHCAPAGSGLHYTPAASDVGQTLRATVSTTGSGVTFTAPPAVSAAVLPGPPPTPTPAPTPTPTPATSAAPLAPSAPSPAPGAPIAPAGPVMPSDAEQRAAAERLLRGPVTRRRSAQLRRLTPGPTQARLFLPRKRRFIGEWERALAVLVAPADHDLQVSAKITLTGERPGPRRRVWAGWTPTRAATPRWERGPATTVQMKLPSSRRTVGAATISPLPFRMTAAQRGRARRLSNVRVTLTLRISAGEQSQTLRRTLPVRVAT